MPMDHLGDALTIGVLVVGFIVWLIRLEGIAQQNRERIVEVDAKSSKAIEKLEVKHEALDSKIVDKLSVIEKSLAKIEGRLSIEHEERC